MRTVSTEVYKYEELSDEAKEKAKDWYRQYVFNDSGDWEHVYEWVAEVADLIGIDLRQRPVKLMNGTTRFEPCIYWSGFSSQGDGACFEGTYRYKKGSIEAVKKHANDEALNGIVKELCEVQRKHFYRLTATVTHRGYYYHSGCTSIEVEDREDVHKDLHGDDENIAQLLREFMDWIYEQLENEYEYQNSDEAVEGNIICNEYEFTEEGEIV